MAPVGCTVDHQYASMTPKPDSKTVYTNPVVGYFAHSVLRQQDLFSAGLFLLKFFMENAHFQLKRIFLPQETDGGRERDAISCSSLPWMVLWPLWRPWLLSGHHNHSGLSPTTEENTRKRSRKKSNGTRRNITQIL